MYRYMLLFGLLGALTPLLAEPWIANRFAQNCAGCHAPGRKNLPLKDRRCTLTCQGCHVNPNGGGLRSHYGKWNEDRWLWSYRTDYLAQKKRTAPYKNQRYAKALRKQIGKVAEGEEAPDPKTLKFSKKRYSVVESKIDDVPEQLYDRRDGLEYVTAQSRLEFLHQIPVDDPYYEILNTKIDGGADIRWQMQRGNTKVSSETTDTDEKTWASFLMSADLSLRWRPVYKRYHLVYEGRYLGQPKTKNTHEVADTMVRRSAYLLVDDLPFASYAMAGYYRPLFGHYVPDHTALGQRTMSYALQETPSIYTLNYQSVSIGASPYNIFFGNIHYFTRQFGATNNDTNTGYAVNLGGRFVKLGGSIVYSFWDSQKTENLEGSGEESTRVQMHSLNAGMQISRVTMNLDISQIAKDRPNDAYAKSMVATFDTHTQVWRQNYVTVSYAQSNMSEDLRPGASTQLRVGTRSFLTQGVDVALMWNEENNEVNESDNTLAKDTVVQELLMQLHLYM